MSGVYINDIEMPKSCRYCAFRHLSITENSFCTATHEKINYMDERTKRRSDCPLISVPDHGRLVDADALKESFCANCFADEKPMECSEPCMDMKIILDAPTIIPAEVEE